jgi:hypothetical protein
MRENSPNLVTLAATIALFMHSDRIVPKYI